MAANSIAKLAVLITGDASPLRVATQQAAQSVSSLASGIGSMSGSTGMLSSLAGAAGFGAIAAGATAAAAAVIAFGKTGIAAAANIEQLQISFEVMAGSAQTARDLIADMQSLSLETPLEMQDVSRAGKTLMAMGEPTEAIITDLKMLGDVASGTGQPLNELAQVFGQVMQAGRLTGNELRQFNERGVPLLTELATQMGVSKHAIRGMVEEGKIGSNDVIAAFEAMTGSGGKFANMMERQADTLTGQWNKFKENITIIAMTVMKPIADMLKTILTSFNEVLDSIVKSLGVIRGSDYKTSDPEAVKRKRDAEQSQKDSEAAANKASDEAKKHQEAMAKRGDALAKSLRTPFEVMKDGMLEAAQLMSDGLISADIYQRAIEKIGDTYKKATDRASELKDAIKPVAAVTRFSVADFSARQQGADQQSKIADEAKKSREIETKILAVETEVRDILKRNPPVSFKVVRLN